MVQTPAARAFRPHVALHALITLALALVFVSGCTSPTVGADATVSAGPSGVTAGVSATASTAPPTSTSASPTTNAAPRGDVVLFNNTSPVPAYGSAHGNQFTFNASPVRLNLTLYVNEKFSGSLTDQESACQTPSNGGYTFKSPSGRMIHQEVSTVTAGGKLQYSTTVPFEAGTWTIQDLWCGSGATHTITVTATDGSIATQGTWTSS